MRITKLKPFPITNKYPLTLEQNVRLLILDLDRTLWSHPDISTTSPPYRRVSDEELVDSNGEVIKLNPCARKLLEDARVKGVLLAVASWNYPEKGMSALEAFGLSDYFKVIVIEPHPFKDKMIRKILGALNVKPEEAVFVDDNPAICERVSKAFPSLKVLNLGRDLMSLCELFDMLG
ncbi:magnesium-dependent phosphatase-1 [Infirmifilum uzonense]|jgi:magnesium-dependent phosphatase-1|uniref:magnesium-dependent phosphatase-1 n=1 Tax=Infirmifilum TaxID=2856573 RepID=UPI0023532AE5